MEEQRFGDGEGSVIRFARPDTGRGWTSSTDLGRRASICYQGKYYFFGHLY
jgi:hypothetical protein